jgi:hypothetical protein
MGLVKSRRFPPPWTVEELDVCFIVKAANGQKLGYVYFDDPRAADMPLTRDEARRIAANVAKLPECREKVARGSNSKAASAMEKALSGFAFVPKPRRPHSGTRWVFGPAAKEEPYPRTRVPRAIKNASTPTAKE